MRKFKMTGNYLATLLLFLSTLSFGTPALADFQKGLDAANRGDYATAFKEWKPLADQGDAVAQYNLGWMYNKGKGVTQDYKEALKWYRLAADQGDVVAQNNLGEMYAGGEGVIQDYKEAVKWWRLAAEGGSATSQRNLGVMYVRGEGVTRDSRRAHMWFNISASQGATNAAENRDAVAIDMTSEDISKAQDMARDCTAKNYKGC